MNIKLIIEELNKIENVKGKLKYLEGIIFKTKDKVLKEKLIKLLKLIQKSGKKRLSFEDIHSEENVKSNKKVALEEIVLHRGEKFEDSNFELKDYLVELPEEIRTTPFEIEKEEKPQNYIPLENYKQLENKEYVPLESEYKQTPEEIPKLNENGIDEFMGLEAEPSVQRENIIDTGEYKRKEILKKNIETQQKKTEEYKRKIMLDLE